jgi:hypothetical protein
VLSHEDRGSCSCSKKFYLIERLGYALKHNVKVKALKHYAT